MVYCRGRSLPQVKRLSGLFHQLQPAGCGYQYAVSPVNCEYAQ